MHVLPESSPMEGALAKHLPHLRQAQRRGLALWVCGAILAHRACQPAVLAALLLPARGGYHMLRQRLREWLYDGAERAAPCATEIAVEHCFAPLLRWVLAWWRGGELALAIDATARGEQLVALVVSVLYRGSALPVAWACHRGRRNCRGTSARRDRQPSNALLLPRACSAWRGSSGRTFGMWAVVSHWWRRRAGQSRPWALKAGSVRWLRARAEPEGRAGRLRRMATGPGSGRSRGRRTALPRSPVNERQVPERPNFYFRSTGGAR